jgi:hypothetical protein
MGPRGIGYSHVMATLTPLPHRQAAASTTQRN